ncbi:MAG: uracil-DNA glycosylase [Pseudomonadota bacterium]
MSNAHGSDDIIIAFWTDCGISALVADAPQNHFEMAQNKADVAVPEGIGGATEPQMTATRVHAASAPAAGPRAALPHHDDGARLLQDDHPQDAVMDAREMARAAPDLPTLHAAIEAFEGCPLKATAMRACPGEGPVGAPIMFVGEAPGRDEDAAGRPFVGRSGKLLDKMIAAIGLSREDVYISNVIPWRPPGNRTPSPIETATCEVFIRREIALVSPKILVPLGGPAAKTLLRNDTGIMRQRGRWTRYMGDDDREVDALATFHPAYLLRTPGEKRRVWQDLLALRARLESAHGFASL